MKPSDPSDPSHFPRRRFLQQTAAGGIGVTALANTPEVLARMMAQGTSPVDVEWAGVAKGLVRIPEESFVFFGMNSDFRRRVNGGIFGRFPSSVNSIRTISVW